MCLKDFKVMFTWWKVAQEKVSETKTKKKSTLAIFFLPF